MNLEADIIEPADDAPQFPEDPLGDQELAIKYCLGQLSFEAFERDQICLYACHSWGAFVRVNESAIEKTLSALSKKSSDDAQYLNLRPDSKMLLIALMYWAKDQILLGFSGATIDIDYGRNDLPLDYLLREIEPPAIHRLTGPIAGPSVTSLERESF